MSLTAPVYLEDLALGMEFRSAEHALDEAQIVSFARQFDPQPFHLDAEAAKDTFFQGLAASGWHTAAITMKLLVDSLVFSQGIIGAGGQIDWPRPTRPDDVLHVLSKIIVTDWAIPPLFYVTLRFSVVAILMLPWLLPMPRPAALER